MEKIEKKAPSNIELQIREERKNFLEKAKKLREEIHSTQGGRNNNDKLILIGGIICIGIAGFFGWKAYSQIQDMNTQIPLLKTKESYNIDILKQNPITKNMLTDISSIGQFKDIETDLDQDLQRYVAHKDNLELSYTYFLQYLFLPKLNIRKELFTDTIKTNLLGSAFLEQNPYNDINLFEKWTNFFSNTNNNETNTISNLHIGDIQEGNGLFTIAINFDFDCPSKSAFLILLEKLTITSDKENLNNLGEFFYYLRQEIKKSSPDTLAQETKDLPKEIQKHSEDEIIGYKLYQRATNNENTNLINDAIINRSIFTMFECKKENLPQCFYKFREKYRNIGSLAYTIGMQDNTKKTEDLKNFIKNLPPIISLKDFNFNKQETKNVLSTTTEKYVGNAKILIYGKDIKDEEMNEITKQLGKQCFGSDKNISIDDALNIITQSINQKADLSYAQNTQDSNMQDLKVIIENIQSNFSNLGNYEKTIRLFEVYRMLNENGLCKTM